MTFLYVTTDIDLQYFLTLNMVDKVVVFILTNTETVAVATPVLLSVQLK